MSGTNLAITPLHLSVSGGQFQGEEVRGVHVFEHGDIAFVLHKGQKGQSVLPLCDGEDGTLVISLGVDEEHDEVAWQSRCGTSGYEAIDRAIKALEVAKWALENSMESL